MKVILRNTIFPATETIIIIPLCLYGRLVIVVMLGNSCPRVERIVWYKPRSKHWWGAINNGVFGSKWWKKNPEIHSTLFTENFGCILRNSYLVCMCGYMHFKCKTQNAGHSLEDTC